MLDCHSILNNPMDLLHGASSEGPLAFGSLIIYFTLNISSKHTHTHTPKASRLKIKAALSSTILN